MCFIVIDFLETGKDCCEFISLKHHQQGSAKKADYFKWVYGQNINVFMWLQLL